MGRFIVCKGINQRAAPGCSQVMLALKYSVTEPEPAGWLTWPGSWGMSQEHGEIGAYFFEEFKFTNCKAEVDLSLCECNLSAATDLPLNFLQVTLTSWSVFPMEGQFIHAIHVPFYGKMLNWSQIKASKHCR